MCSSDLAWARVSESVVVVIIVGQVGRARGGVWRCGATRLPFAKIAQNPLDAVLMLNHFVESEPDRRDAPETKPGTHLDRESVAAGKRAGETRDAGNDKTEVGAGQAGAVPDYDKLEQAAKYNYELANISMEIAQQRISVERGHDARVAAELKAAAS